MTKKILRVAASLLLMLGLAKFARPAVPDRINFQGRLLDSNKLPRNGTFSMTFRVCDSAAGDCATACGVSPCQVWNEAQSVSVSNGVFAAQLGASNPLAASVFSSSVRYLEIIVAGETLGPRERLVTGAYSFRASVTEGLADNALTADSQIAAGANIADSKLATISSSGKVSGAALASLDSTPSAAGLLPNANIDGSSVTKQGNSFNAANKLAQLNGSAVMDSNYGGTGADLSAGASGGVPYFSAAGVMGASALLTANGVVLGGGAGTAPAATSAGGADTVLRVPGAGGAPAFGAIDLSKSAALTSQLTTANGGTGANTFASNGVLYGNAGGVIQVTAQGPANSVLTANAGAPAFSATPTLTSVTLGAGSALSTYLENQTCNMTIAGTTIAGAGTYTYNVCRYSQIGKTVTLQWSVLTTAHTGTGNFRFDGLPLTSLNVANFNQHCIVGWSGTTFAAGTGLKGFIAPNSTSITVVNNPASTAAEAAVAIDATVTLRVNCNYLAN